MIFSLQASPASPILDVPSVALLVLAVVALAFASVAQSVEQAVQRLTLAGVEDLIEEERRNARVLYGLVDHRQRTLLSLRAFRTFWQVVYAVMGTIILVDTRLPWWAVALIAVLVIAALQLLFVSFLPAQWGARNPEGIAWRCRGSYARRWRNEAGAGRKSRCPGSGGPASRCPSG